jgi:hypothetical protein
MHGLQCGTTDMERQSSVSSSSSSSGRVSQCRGQCRVSCQSSLCQSSVSQSVSSWSVTHRRQSVSCQSSVSRGVTSLVSRVVVSRESVVKSSAYDNGEPNDPIGDPIPAHRLDLGTSAVTNPIVSSEYFYSLGACRPGDEPRRQVPAMRTPTVGDTRAKINSAGVRPPSPRCLVQNPRLDRCSSYRPQEGHHDG